MTVEEYLDWYKTQSNGRYELVDGIPFKMSPERNVHALVKGLVFRALSEATEGHGGALVTFVDGPTIATGPRQAREPDVVVHPREGIDWDALRLDRPIVLVEVLSPSTARTDTADKRSEYLAVSTVAHYLLVDPDARSVVHHRRGSAGWVASKPLSEGALALEPPGLSIDVARFFAGLPPRSTR